MNLDEALAFLDAHQNLEASPAVAGNVRGLSLDRMAELMGALGDPHRAYPVVHVTGTNGKGSVTRLTSALLAAHGLVAGSYTSPHLQHLGERIARNGEPIPDADLARVLGDLAALEPTLTAPPSWFELVTAAAFAWFAEVAVDVAVVEVGLLGRWDATNVVDAEVAVITNVGFDHTDGAEGWRTHVAREKAGICKPGSHLVLGETDAEPVAAVLDEVASVAGGGGAAPQVWRRNHELVVRADDLAVGGRRISLRTALGTYDDLFVPLHGRHQTTNVLLAVAATEAFFGRALDPDVVAGALAEVSVPGRLEVVHRRPLVVLDGAHNRDGARALRQALDDFGTGGRRTLVLGMLAGRDPAAYLEALGVAAGDATFDRVVCTTAPSPRGVAARDLAAAVATAWGRPAEVVDDPLAAVRRATDGSGEDDAVVVTGSLYVVGAVRSALARPGSQGRGPTP